jgi:glycosyltransferase involved in cell wall biosynthesis
MSARFIARGIPSQRIQVLYNPLNLDYFKPEPLLRRTTRHALGYADDDIVVGYIGALHPDKGIMHLADAVNQAMVQIPKLKALWLGEGPAAAELAARISSGGFVSRHSIHQWKADVRPYYAAMDMLAIPSVESETFGRVSIEAQASGIPVMCSDIGGIPETLSPGVTGLLLPPGDIPAWRDAILVLAGDVKLREKMSQQGRDWVTQQFSAQVIARQFVKLLQNGQ